MSSQLRTQMQAIPKTELHRHLECSMRWSTVKEIALKTADAETLKLLKTYMTEKQWHDHFLVTSPMGDLDSVLRKFLAIRGVLATEEILTRITFETLEDCLTEGTKIVELRYAPTFIQGGHPQLSFEKIHSAILKGVEKAKHLPIAVGLIATIQRILPVKDAERVVDFVAENHDTFVGIDLADNEVGFDCLPFAPAFLKAKKAGVHITVHSGEAIFDGSPEAVRTAIEKLGAERIGHGVQIYRSQQVMDFVRKHQVPLELCPTSNWLTNAVESVRSHPFRQLMEAGVPVTINSDDPGVFAIDLVNEYELLAREQKLTAVEFDRCNDIAAANSFIPFELKQKYWPRKIDKSLAAFDQ